MSHNEQIVKNMFGQKNDLFKVKFGTIYRKNMCSTFFFHDTTMHLHGVFWPITEDIIVTRGMNLHLTWFDYDSEGMDLTVKRFSMHLFLQLFS